MENPMNILERIDSIFEARGEGPDEAKTIDMSDQTERMYTLKNCRGPCVGWDDYAAGKDYQPPRYFSSEVPYGPKDMGKHGIVSAEDSKAIKFDGANPFSRKYGGVRPWCPGEVLMTMMAKGTDKDSKGILWTIAKKGTAARAGLAALGRWDENDADNAVQQGAAAALRVLSQDQARIGVRFTSWIGIAIEQGIIAGVPAGYHDEYRKARGLKTRTIDIAKKALRDAQNGEPIEDHILALNRAFVDVAKNKDPGPGNPYGLLPPKLLQIKSELRGAITTRNAKQIQQAIEKTEQEFDSIREQEDEYFSPGATTGGAVGSKPRDYGSMQDYNKAVKFLKLQRDIAEKAMHRISAGKQLDGIAEQIEAIYDRDFPLTAKGHDQSGLAGPRDKFPGMKAIKDRLIEAINSGDKTQLHDFILYAELAQEILKHQEGLKAKGIGSTTMDTKSKTTGKEVERTNFAGMERDVDSLRSKENIEILETVIAQISPYRDRRSDKKRSAEEAIEILGDIEDLIDSHTDGPISDDEVRMHLTNINRDLKSSLGEYQEEIKAIINTITGTLRSEGEFSDIKQDIADTIKVANDDINSDVAVEQDTVTPKQYRMLLRLFGIKNYPERGTPDDPEINEQGGKSRWAAAGYPAAGGTEMGKKANVSLWSDIFEKTDEETGEPVCSVSDVYIGRQKKEALSKFEAMVAKMRSELSENRSVDNIDLRLLYEFHLQICRMVIESVLPGGMKLIYG